MHRYEVRLRNGATGIYTGYPAINAPAEIVARGANGEKYMERGIIAEVFGEIPRTAADIRRDILAGCRKEIRAALKTGDEKRAARAWETFCQKSTTAEKARAPKWMFSWITKNDTGEKA